MQITPIHYLLKFNYTCTCTNHTTSFLPNKYSPCKAMHIFNMHYRTYSTKSDHRRCALGRQAAHHHAAQQSEPHEHETRHNTRHLRTDVGGRCPLSLPNYGGSAGGNHQLVTAGDWPVTSPGNGAAGVGETNNRRHHRSVGPDGPQLLMTGWPLDGGLRGSMTDRLACWAVTTAVVLSDG